MGNAALRSGLILAAVVVLCAVPAEADYWYEHYARADEALVDEHWHEAIRELNEALSRKGDPGAHTRTYGMNVVAYFPYLKLGIAYAGLGQYEAAMQAFDTERQLGAIMDSAEHLQELGKQQTRVVEARDAAAASEAEQVAEIVSRGLAEATALIDGAQLEQAMEVLGQVLSVAPENNQAVDLMAELRRRVGEEEAGRQAAERAEVLVAGARTMLDDGQASEAARRLREALELAPTAEARQLLDRAEQALRAEMIAGRREAERRQLIDEAVQRALVLEGEARFAEALTALQPVLAAEPGNRRALEMQARILTAERAAALSLEVQQWLQRAADEMAAGHGERAVVAANRVLNLDSHNPRAKELVAEAYQVIGARLLGRAAAQSLPPAIRFADLREVLSDGSRVQQVSSPDFRLSGVVIDDSSVTLTAHDEAGGELQTTTSEQAGGGVLITEFVLRRHLDPGLLRIDLVAVDQDGLSSRGEYAVNYVRPMLRQPWFAALLATVAAAVVVVVMIVRASHRRRLRRRRFNPYIAGAPVLDRELFVGREQLIERILETIHNNSLLLHGERRIGKTSLQHHLKRRIEKLDDRSYRFYPVYIDLQGTPESRFFATVAEDIFQELGPQLGDLRPCAALVDGAPFGYRDLVAELRRILAALTAVDQRQVKLVLLIDEVDELNAYDPRINQRLRSLFMKSFAEHLVAVVSGVEIRRQWEREGSPWYNFFEEVEVSAIHPRAARELIVRPIEDIFKVEAGVVERIIQLSQCKPYKIQRLCVALVNRLHEQGRRKITLADVEAVGPAR